MVLKSSSVHLFIVFFRFTFFLHWTCFCQLVPTLPPKRSEVAQPDGFQKSLLAAGPFGSCIHWWVPGTHRWSRLVLNCHVAFSKLGHGKVIIKPSRVFSLLLLLMQKWLLLVMWAFVDSWTVEMESSFGLWYCRNMIVRFPQRSKLVGSREYILHQCTKRLEGKTTRHLTSENQTNLSISLCLYPRAIQIDEKGGHFLLKSDIHLYIALHLAWPRFERGPSSSEVRIVAPT